MDTLGSIERVNDLNAETAYECFFRCCGCREWATKMSQARPFASVESLLSLAEFLWWNLPASCWKEAFSAHPRIGDNQALQNVQLTQGKNTTHSWEGDEQKGVKNAAADVVSSLAIGNQNYENKFGYIFLICATGKSANEMLTILNERMLNLPDDELRVAAAEHVKITEIRLLKLLRELSSSALSSKL